MARNAIIILAAGNSSRLGRSKQLVPINGVKLINNVVKQATQAKVDEVLVVLGAEFQLHKDAITDSDVKIIENTNWRKGMGSSLKKGVQYFSQIADAPEKLIICVCDQPYVTSSIFNQLIDSISDTNPLVACRYKNEAYGVPAGFYKSEFSNLLLINDRSGAKSILREQEDNLELIGFPDGDLDVDKQEDLELLLGNS